MHREGCLAVAASAAKADLIARIDRSESYG